MGDHLPYIAATDHKEEAEVSDGSGTLAHVVVSYRGRASGLEAGTVAVIVGFGCFEFEVEVLVPIVVHRLMPDSKLAHFRSSEYSQTSSLRVNFLCRWASPLLIQRL